MLEILLSQTASGLVLGGLYVLIAIGLSIADGLLTVEIRDDARPFDPRKPTPAAVGDSLQARKLGGLGLQFVKNLMDDLDYRRIDGTNVVRISKKLGAEAG